MVVIVFNKYCMRPLCLLKRNYGASLDVTASGFLAASFHFSRTHSPKLGEKTKNHTNLHRRGPPFEIGRWMPHFNSLWENMLYIYGTSLIEKRCGIKAACSVFGLLLFHFERGRGKAHFKNTNPLMFLNLTEIHSFFNFVCVLCRKIKKRAHSRLEC